MPSLSVPPPGRFGSSCKDDPTRGAPQGGAPCVLFFTLYLYGGDTLQWTSNRIHTGEANTLCVLEHIKGSFSSGAYVGVSLQKGALCGTIGEAKSVSSLRAPLNGGAPVVSFLHCSEDTESGHC